MQKIKENSDPLKTVLTITLGFIFVFFITKQHWLINLSFIVGFIGLMSTFIANKIDFLWMKLTWILSKIFPNILLSSVFYFFLTPIALLSRLVSKKDILKLKNNSISTFKINQNSFEKSSFEKPW